MKDSNNIQLQVDKIMEFVKRTIKNSSKALPVINSEERYICIHAVLCTFSS